MVATPHNAAIATRNVGIRNTDNWFPYHCDWKMARGRIALRGMDSREMVFWEGSYIVVTGAATLRPRPLQRIKTRSLCVKRQRQLLH
jgi:hypothetical protein